MKKKKGTNVYEKKVTLGRDENGTPVRKSFTGRTIAELNARIEEAKRVWEQMNDTDSVLFGPYARRWLSTAKAVKSLNTRQMYTNAIEKHIIPAIGDLYFNEITLSDLQGIINDRAEKYETCNKIRLTLKQVYAFAVDEGIKGSAIKVDKLALPPKKDSEKRALTEAEKDAIFNAPLTDEQRIYVHLLYFTGLRREEALALSVGDVDFERNVVSVRRTIVFDKNTPVVKDSAKSSAGRRDVPIPADFIEELKAYVETCDRLLFPMPTRPKEYMSLSSYVKFWNGIVAALIPYAPEAESLTAHIFRHNYATMLYYSEISLKKAAALMGHSNTQMIMQVYAHLDDEKENAADKLTKVITSRQKSVE